MYDDVCSLEYDQMTESYFFLMYPQYQLTNINEFNKGYFRYTPS